MNKEEKEAIEYWKRDIKLYNYNTQLASEHYAQIVLNLIQKQEKIIEDYEEMIINHKKQLKQSGIYGYDYDLKIIEKEVKKDEK